MSDWNVTPRYKPFRAPFLDERRVRGRLQRPYMACWITEAGEASVLGAFHLYKSAVAHCRSSMNDGSSLPINHHSRFYVWDSSREPWNPEDLNCWTPVADFPRNQRVLSR